MFIQPFNTTHILTITIMPMLGFIIIHLVSHSLHEQSKRRLLLSICYFNIVLYVVYKIVQAHEQGYAFDIFTNLPLHLCNLNLILLPIALHTKNKTLMAYQLYFGVPLAALALITVHPLFISRPIWHFTPFVYFFYHSMLVVLPFVPVKHRFYTPSFKNILQPTLLLVVLTAVIHSINIVFRATGLAADANYFFTYGLEGDFFTELLWQFIPYPFFFLLPALLLFVPFIILVTLSFHLQHSRHP